MKIGIYNPYFDSLGGGEYYCLTLASYWSEKHEVEIFWEKADLREKAKTRFDLDLSRVKFTKNIFNLNFFQKLILSKQYDLIFFLSDGSIPTSFAKYNILHFQVPFAKISYSNIKLSRYQAIVCNSQFTLDHLDSKLKEKLNIIYPPVRPIAEIKKTKSNLILSVGRFTSHFQAKKQEVLIEAFKNAQISGNLKGWKLILAGGLMESDQRYFDELNNKSKNFPIELLFNITRSRLVELYNEAKIYWHAAGYGQTNPELMEHFGISTVEAMSAGCVPIVFAGGGQLEIVDDGVNGYLWKTTDELIQQSDGLTKANNLMAKLSNEAKIKSSTYNEARFFNAFDDLLKRITI